MLEQPFPEGLQPVERGHMEKTLGQGKRMSRKEQQGQCDELTTASIAHPLHCLKEEGNSELKLSPGRRQGWEESVLRFCFIFLLPNSHL